MQCRLCENAIPPPEVIPYSYNGEGTIVTGLVGTISGESGRNREIYLSTLSALYCHFLLGYSSNKYKEINRLLQESILNFIHFTKEQWAGIAPSVQRLATDQTVGASNPVQGRDFPHQPRPTLGLTQPPIQWVSGHSRLRRGVDCPSHLARRLTLILLTWRIG